MRHHTAIFLVIVLALASSEHVRAATSEDTQPAFRNPIEWLFSDIGELLSSAASKVTQASKVAPEEPASKTPVEPDSAKKEPATPAEEASPSPADEKQAVAETSSFRNPLSWLFSDLARIFKPDLTIEQSPAPVKTEQAAAEEPAPEVAGVAPANPSPLPDLAAETAPDSEQTTAQGAAPDETTKDPISWLFRDLARLFAPATTQPGDETVAAPPADAVPAEPVETDIAQADEQDAKTNTQPVQVAEAPAAAQEIEIGPWVPHPKNDPFNPDDSLFASNGTPLLAVSDPVHAAEPVETVTIDVAAEQPVIRERPAHRPGERNHAALGHNHKAVTPDPLDDSIVDRVLESLFGIDEPVEAEETVANKVSDRIVPEESLDLGYTSPDAQVPDKKLTRLEDGPLTNIDLFMGADRIIGAPYDAAKHDSNTCIERALHGSVFCVENLNWPASIASSFATDTAFLLPSEGVVRYENGKLSRVYSVFKASDFAKVVKFMQQRFGPPQEREIGWMHMLEAPKLPNTTFRWQAFSADRHDAIVLEVRNYDDLRRSFADMEHGMVRLYRNGSRPVFKHISTMDLMLLQRRRVARAPVEVNTPPKQN